MMKIVTEYYFFLNSNFEHLGNLYLHLKIQKDVYLISRMLII